MDDSSHIFKTKKSLVEEAFARADEKRKIIESKRMLLALQNKPQESSVYFSTKNRQLLRELLANVSESDAEKIIQHLFNTITNTNDEFRLSPEIENALTQMILDKSV